MRYVFQPQARKDIEERSDHYEEKGGEELARRFVVSVTRALERLLEFPEVGSPRHAENPRLLGLRSWPVPDFEDVRLYYLIQGDLVRVIRILHGRQNVGAILG